jgi:hypothetical protein
MAFAIRPKEERVCEDHALIIRRAAGLTFAKIFNHYFGDTAVVLIKEGPEGEDLRFAASELWLRANTSPDNGINNEDGEIAFEHVKRCDSAACIEANQRFAAILPFIKEGKIPGGGSVAITSVFVSRGSYGEAMAYSREDGFGEAIDGIKPFFLWFIDHPNDWKWPRQ